MPTPAEPAPARSAPSDRPAPRRPAARTAPASRAGDIPPPAARPARRAEVALRARLAGRLEDGERVVAWARAWVSRDGRWSTLLSARTRDVAVLTDRRLLLFSTGFFSRLPRRRVLGERLSGVRVEARPAAAGRRLRVATGGRDPLRLDLRGDAAGARFADALLAATRGEARS